jgi:UDP-N-acetylglucosamine/UDP-N-acetylgalactosamine diphosphorylase
MHIFQREFLERALHDDRALPFHIARKIVPYVDEAGRLVTPTVPNAFKFERFIFDVLPWSHRSLIVEANRADEFNPVKNQTGDDSPETARAALMALHRRWLRAAGVEIADDVPVEISPLVASGPADLAGRFPSGTRITERCVIERE